MLISQKTTSVNVAAAQSAAGLSFSWMHILVSSSFDSIIPDEHLQEAAARG